MHCMLMDLLHGFEVLSTTEETLFNSRNVSRLVQNNGVLFYLLVRDHDDLVKSVFGRNVASLRLIGLSSQTVQLQKGDAHHSTPLMQHLTKLNKRVFLCSTYYQHTSNLKVKTWHETKMAFQELSGNIMVFVESFLVCCL